MQNHIEISFRLVNLGADSANKEITESRKLPQKKDRPRLHSSISLRKLSHHDVSLAHHQLARIGVPASE